jgi:uncharacterized repeat protein (TIGR01451 family)
MNRSSRSIPLLCLAAMISTAAIAQVPAPKVTVSVDVEREVQRGGDTAAEREPVDIARPGDVLVYTVRASNVGNAAAIGARVEDPIPSGTVLIPESVSTVTASPSASLDGGKTWTTFPAMVRETAEDGTERTVPAPAEQYTHLRWALDGALPPGESRDLSFKVRVM